MEFSIKTEQKYYLITINGEMKTPSCHDIPCQFKDKIPLINKPVVIDLKNVTYLDSRGLGILVFLFTHIKKAGQKLYLTEIKDEVFKIIKLTALDNIFSIYPSIKSAEKSME
ncbi:STAS domain-containing protein [bacterium]|nr:STAS domain-containing protein [bacterium]